MQKILAISSVIMITLSLYGMSSTEKIDFSNKKQAIDSIQQAYQNAFANKIDARRYFSDKKSSVDVKSINKQNIYQPSLLMHRFTKEPKIDNWVKLQEVVDASERFIKKAANNDPDLLQPLNLAITANNDLMNTLKILYNTYYAKSLQDKDKDKIKEIKNVLKQNILRLTSAKELLHKASFYRSAKKDARAILNTLLHNIEDINTKALFMAH